MKEIEVFVKTVVDGMKVMAQGIETLAEKLDTIAKSRFDEKAKAKPARKAPAKPKKVVKKAVKKPATAVDTVLGIINRSKKGVDTATLVKKTGYDNKKVANLVYKLKKQGKIKSEEKGVYLKV
jgi:predicted Rossmann fold nucleotide-binding protein DprA/Smf involved in DNA uptake